MICVYSAALKYNNISSSDRSRWIKHAFVWHSHQGCYNWPCSAVARGGRRNRGGVPKVARNWALRLSDDVGSSDEGLTDENFLRRSMAAADGDSRAGGTIRKRNLLALTGRIVFALVFQSERPDLRWMVFCLRNSRASFSCPSIIICIERTLVFGNPSKPVSISFWAPRKSCPS